MRTTPRRSSRGRALRALTSQQGAVKVLGCGWVGCWQHVAVANGAMATTAARMAWCPQCRAPAQTTTVDMLAL